MGRFNEIVGYVWQADTWCTDCINPLGEVVTDGGIIDSERFLDLVAGLINTLGTVPFDRYDESTYDSGDFPKVIFSDEECDHRVWCCRCDQEIDIQLMITEEQWAEWEKLAIQFGESVFESVVEDGLLNRYPELSYINHIWMELGEELQPSFEEIGDAPAWIFDQLCDKAADVYSQLVSATTESE